jgi:hypothetical protein
MSTALANTLACVFFIAYRGVAVDLFTRCRAA